ncbi:MAG: hypothetical protein J0H55_10555 [Chitinophagaceae bacterium]|nr:hypothetical protein [Chitinophagaceae bacterium]
MKKEKESSMQKLSKEEMKKIMGGFAEPPKCDKETCEAKSNDELTCFCADSGALKGNCLCVR